MLARPFLTWLSFSAVVVHALPIAYRTSHHDFRLKSCSISDLDSDVVGLRPFIIVLQKRMEQGKQKRKLWDNYFISEGEGEGGAEVGARHSSPESQRRKRPHPPTRAEPGGKRRKLGAAGEETESGSHSEAPDGHRTWHGLHSPTEGLPDAVKAPSGAQQANRRMARERQKGKQRNRERSSSGMSAGPSVLHHPYGSLPPQAESSGTSTRPIVLHHSYGFSASPDRMYHHSPPLQAATTGVGHPVMHIPWPASPYPAAHPVSLPPASLPPAHPVSLPAAHVSQPLVLHAPRAQAAAPPEWVLHDAFDENGNPE